MKVIGYPGGNISTGTCVAVVPSGHPTVVTVVFISIAFIGLPQPTISRDKKSSDSFILFLLKELTYCRKATGRVKKFIVCQLYNGVVSFSCCK